MYTHSHIHENMNTYATFLPKMAKWTGDFTASNMDHWKRLGLCPVPSQPGPEFPRSRGLPLHWSEQEIKKKRSLMSFYKLTPSQRGLKL